MEISYKNILGSERTVEVVFIEEAVHGYTPDNGVILDVGGIPTRQHEMIKFYNSIKNSNLSYKICDFRGGEYQGDFVTMDIEEKFDTVIFLSSLEHFPQCTEGDMVYREGEDRKGFEKALSILKPGGYIILTVPFGKHRWQDFHQNYNMQGILDLSKGSDIVAIHTYSLIEDEWIATPPEDMEEILYTNKAYGVGCFVFQKPE